MSTAVGAPWARSERHRSVPSRSPPSITSSRATSYGRLARIVSRASSADKATSTDIPASASPRARLPATSGSSSTTSTRTVGIVFARTRRIVPASDSIPALVNDVIAADGGVLIRRMRDHPDDYALIVDWRNRPHVREWWDPDDPPLTLDGAIEELRPLTDGADANTAAIIEFEGAAVGYLQFYPWDEETAYLAEVGVTIPGGAWGLDIFIGEDSLVNQGIGSRTVRPHRDPLVSLHGRT